MNAAENSGENPENKPPELDSTEGPNVNIGMAGGLALPTNPDPVADTQQYELRCQICGRVDPNLDHQDTLCAVQHAGGWTCGGRMALTRVPGTGAAGPEVLTLETVGGVLLTLDAMGQAEIETGGAVLRSYHPRLVLESVDKEIEAAEQRAAKLREWKAAYTGDH